jgi:DUF4097 and DUF4098 domain-containing protein YvlB
MNTFLNGLKNELLLAGFSKKETDEIITDYQDMIDQAVRQGLKESEIESTFGSMKQIVLEIKTDQKPKDANDIGKEVQTFHVEDIDNIDIDLVNEDIRMATHEETYIKLSYDGVYDSNHVLIETQQKTLTIKNKKKYQGFKKNKQQKLSFYLYIPSKMRLNQVAVGSINGEIAVLDIQSNQLKAYSVNGLTKLSHNETIQIKYDGVNGKTWIQNNFTDHINAKTVSGKLDIEDNDINDTLSITNISAPISINNSMPLNLKINTVSGHIDAKECYPETLSVNSVSGHVNIKNQDKTKNINIESKRSISGKINIM